MDVLELDTRITGLLTNYQFADAEQELLRAKAQASEENDSETLEHILSSLGELYCVMEPPELEKAESCFAEVERIAGTAYSKANTAMMLYWSRHDPICTLEKAQDAIKAARNEGDDKTLYQSLSLAGLAQIDLRDFEAANQTFASIREMVQRRSRIVIADETLFWSGSSQ